MKTKYIVSIIIGIVIIIGVVLVICLINKKKDPVESSKEIKNLKNLHYSYSVGYAMYAYNNYDIKCEESCTITIKPNGYPDEEAKTYPISDEMIEEVLNVLNKYKVSKWDGFKKSDQNVLDGNSFSFSLDTKDGDSISASGYMMWPDNYRNVKSELEEIFESLIPETDFKDK